jgi:hypothetical protein
MFKSSLTPVAMAVTTFAAIALLAGCTSAPVEVAKQLPVKTEVMADANIPTFFDSWSLTNDDDSNESAGESPAIIDADGTVELLFMFENGDTPPPIVNAFVRSGDDGFRVALTCNNSDVRANMLFACITPRFTDPTGSTEYRAVIRTETSSIEGTATIKRDK